MRIPLPTLAALGTLVACGTNHAPVDPHAPRAVSTISNWDLDRGGVLLGRMRLLEIDDPEQPVRFYRVETPSGKWVGYVDGSGRVYRYVPFEEQEQFIGIYTMAEALALLLEVDGEIEMTERPVAAEATTRRRP